MDMIDNRLKGFYKLFIYLALVVLILAFYGQTQNIKNPQLRGYLTTFAELLRQRGLKNEDCTRYVHFIASYYKQPIDYMKPDFIKFMGLIDKAVFETREGDHDMPEYLSRLLECKSVIEFASIEPLTELLIDAVMTPELHVMNDRPSLSEELNQLFRDLELSDSRNVLCIRIVHLLAHHYKIIIDPMTPNILLFVTLLDIASFELRDGNPIDYNSSAKRKGKLEIGVNQEKPSSELIDILQDCSLQKMFIRLPIADQHKLIALDNNRANEDDEIIRPLVSIEDNNLLISHSILVGHVRASAQISSRGYFSSLDEWFETLSHDLKAIDDDLEGEEFQIEESNSGTDSQTNQSNKVVDEIYKLKPNVNSPRCTRFVHYLAKSFGIELSYKEPNVSLYQYILYRGIASLKRPVKDDEKLTALLKENYYNSLLECSTFNSFVLLEPKAEHKYVDHSKIVKPLEVNRLHCINSTSMPYSQYEIGQSSSSSIPDLSEDFDIDRTVERLKKGTYDIMANIDGNKKRLRDACTKLLYFLANYYCITFSKALHKRERNGLLQLAYDEISDDTESQASLKDSVIISDFKQCFEEILRPNKLYEAEYDIKEAGSGCFDTKTRPVRSITYKQAIRPRIMEARYVPPNHFDLVRLFDNLPLSYLSVKQACIAYIREIANYLNIELNESLQTYKSLLLRGLMIEKSDRVLPTSHASALSFCFLNVRKLIATSMAPELDKNFQSEIGIKRIYNKKPRKM